MENFLHPKAMKYFSLKGGNGLEGMRQRSLPMRPRHPPEADVDE
jgi:hypothetical protein